MTNEKHYESCAKIEEALGAVLSGDASPAERARVEAHLSSCPVCRATFTDFAPFLARLRKSAQSSPVPDGLAERVLARLPTPASRVVPFPRRIRWAAGALAGLAAAAGFVLIVGRGPVPMRVPSHEPIATLSQAAPEAQSASPAAVSSATAPSEPPPRAAPGAPRRLSSIPPDLLAEAVPEIDNPMERLAEIGSEGIEGEILASIPATDPGDMTNMIENLTDREAEEVLAELQKMEG